MSATHGQERPMGPVPLDALAHPRRRWIVETLRSCEVLDVAELASGVAAWERNAEPNAVEGSDQQRTMVELIHVDLPVLADAGVIEYDAYERTVRDATDATDGELDSKPLPPAVVDALADARRRRTLSILAEHVTPLSVTDLACDLASAELDVPLDDVPVDYRDAIRVALHHCHLPKLADVGLVHYDESAREVERTSRLLEQVDERIQEIDRRSGSVTHGER